MTVGDTGSTAPELNCRYLPMNIIEGSRARRGIRKDLDRRLMAQKSNITFSTAMGTKRSPKAVMYQPLEGFTTIDA